MSDQQRPLEAFLLAEGCGSLQLAVPLKGRLVLRTGESADPYLVQTDRGAWIVGVKGAVGLKVDLLSAHPLRY